MQAPALSQGAEDRGADNRADPIAFSIIASDGVMIRGHEWSAVGGSASRPVVVICPATAVLARYYGRFARWLAGQGAEVVTFDYRGIGASRPERLRGFSAGWVDWGALDTDAVLGHAVRRFPGREICVVGHSIGGFAIGLAPAAQSVARIVTVGAQFAYWRDYAAGPRAAMYLKWHLVVPVLTRLFGYFPGARLGWLEDMPRGVARDWSRMGPRFEETVETDLPRTELATWHGRTRARLLAIGLADDPYGTDAAIGRLLAYYRGADRTHLRIDPRDIGVPQIGHFAFFHSRFAPTLWPVARDWLFRGNLAVDCPGTVL